MSPLSRIYTVPMLVGSNKQNLSVQVDTGSSDLVRSVFLLYYSLSNSKGLMIILFALLFAVVVLDLDFGVLVGCVDVVFDFRLWTSQTCVVRFVEFETDR